MVNQITIEALRGTRIGGRRQARCTTCGAHLFDDAPVTGYAYRFSDESSLSVAGLYCTQCDRSRIDHPTLGAHEVQFRSRLDRDDQAFVLDDVAVLEYSPPTTDTRDQHYR